ncbi:MAG: hypothetical protein J5I59_07380 [Saprospiraceae bacterium]|nr:hypothetical protein [Saprospiraceae bacterium]
MKANYLFLFLLLFITVSCGKDDSEQPASACCDCLKEASITGKGTMSMKINGITWSNCNVKNENYPTVDVYWDPEHEMFRIRGKKYFSSQASESFSINVDKPFLGDFTKTQKLLFRLFYSGSYNGWAEFAMDTSKPFSLNVHHLDEQNRIISGTFECCLKKLWGDDYSPDSLAITEGRFDTHY